MASTGSPFGSGPIQFLNYGVGDAGYIDSSNPSRWGDYSGIALDPVLAQNVWVATENGAIGCGALTSCGKWSTSIAVVTFVGVPQVSSISPSNGPPSGGFYVRIEGANFRSVSQVLTVTFGGIPAKSVFEESESVVIAETPAHLPGTVDVQVSTAGGISPTTPADLYAFKPVLPLVDLLFPAKGSFSGGETVLIDGAYFDGATSVTFDGINSPSFTLVRSSILTAVVPAKAAFQCGTFTGVSVPVEVTTPVGTSTHTGTYEYVVVPTVYSVVEDHGSAIRGQTVTIHGCGYLDVSEVRFGGQRAESFEVVDDSTITAVSSPAEAGLVTMYVTTPGGTSQAPPYCLPPLCPFFTFEAPSEQISPNQGHRLTQVAVSGAGFRPGESVVVSFKTGLSKQASINLFKVRADSAGHFSGTGVIPGNMKLDPGAYDVVAAAKRSGIRLSAIFTLIP